MRRYVLHPAPRTAHVPVGPLAVLNGDLADAAYLCMDAIEAGEGIKAGEGFNIFAGLRLRLSDWTLYAKVIAKDKPENLVSGSWVEPWFARAGMLARRESAAAAQAPRS